MTTQSALVAFVDAHGWQALALIAVWPTLLLTTAWTFAALLRRASAAVRYCVWQFALMGLLALPVVFASLPGVPLGISLRSAASTRSAIMDPPALDASLDSTAMSAAIVGGAQSSARNWPTPLADAGRVADGSGSTEVGRAGRQVEGGVAAARGVLDRTFAAPSARPSASWGTRLIVVWAVGVAVQIGWLLVFVVRAKRLVRAGDALVNPRIGEIHAELERQFSLPRGLRLVKAAAVDAPAVVGIRRPCILLPADCVEWSAEKMRMVLSHELAHVERRDVFWQLAARAVAALYWVHPLTWLAVRRMRQERERACDDRVLCLGLPAVDYAVELAEFAAALAGRPSPLLGSVGMAEQLPLEDRVRSILDGSVARNLASPKVRGVLLAAVACLVLLLGVLRPFAPVRTTATEPPPSSKQDAAKSVKSAAEAAKTIEKPADDQVDGSVLELMAKGTALLPDGRPAPGAIIYSRDNFDHSSRLTRADRTGAFELQDPFLSDLRLHATTPDGRYQATMLVGEEAVRSAISRPLTIKLEKSKPHLVVVMAKGEPVEGAHVCVSGYVAQQTSVTRDDGVAIVWIPAGEKVQSVVAWHPQHGLNGVYNRQNDEGRTKTGIALLPPGPHVIRLLDQDGHPVAGRTIAASIHPAGGDWIAAKDTEATRATTGEDGEVRYDWFPAKGIQYVDVDVLDREWKIDEVNHDKTPEGLTVVRVRRKFLVEGRVILPPGAEARGILVTGFGFGAGHRGDIPRTRTRKDGSFSIHVPAGHGYVIGVHDLEWTSEIWSGEIVATEGGPQREIVLHGERATPLEFVVTRGPSKQPIADAWLNIDRRAQVEWTDEKGEARSGSGGIRGWLRTSEQGRARTAVGRGEIEVRINSGEWTETKTIQVNSVEPVRVGFHREWTGSRALSARPTVDGKKYVPSPDAVALAWTKRSGLVAKSHQAVVANDGTVRVEFDEYELSLLLIDRQRERSGYATIGKDDREVDLPMRANAVYSGTLVDDRDGHPLAGRTVRMITETSFLDVVEPQQTDGMGRFEFTNLTVGVPLRLRIEEERGRPTYFLFDRDRMFAPGERRLGDVAKAVLMDGDHAVSMAPVERPLTERIATAVENGRLTGLRTLVILEGDDSKLVKHVAARLQSGDETDAVYRYLPVAATAQQQREGAEALAARKWPRPEAGEIVMVATDDGSEAAAMVRLKCSDIKLPVEQGVQFIERHMPPTRDGRKRLEEAKGEARRSNRSLWVITGGPRCGPCFRLTRWINRHHDLLEKDLVIVELTAKIDLQADEINDELGGSAHGIPFHAMMSPEGEVIVSSKGPLGNIGMPGSIEGIRHFRTMLEAVRQRMTPVELGALVDSLTEDD